MTEFDFAITAFTLTSIAIGAIAAWLRLIVVGA
jgi:hypothetical protein